MKLYFVTRQKLLVSCFQGPERLELLREREDNFWNLEMVLKIQSVHEDFETKIRLGKKFINIVCRIQNQLKKKMNQYFNEIVCNKFF